ncbi:MAG: hypothetical protein ABI306_04295 [Caulobacteraceae bacterium]
MDDKLSFIGGEALVDAEVQPVEAVEAPVAETLETPPEPERPRAADGKFAHRPEPPPPPEPTEQLRAALYAQNLKVSRKFADRQYGTELVGKAHDWAAARCDADPHFNQRMRASDDPYEAAVQAYNREEILKEVTPADLDAFRAWKAAQSGAPAPTAAQPPSSPSPPPPPRSLVTAPGNGAVARDHVDTSPGSAFAATIKG